MCSIMLARQLLVILVLDTAVSSALTSEAHRKASWKGSVTAAEGQHARAPHSKSPHVNQQQRLFPLGIIKLDFKNCLKSVLQHHVELLQKRVVGVRIFPQDI